MSLGLSFTLVLSFKEISAYSRTQQGGADKFAPLRTLLQGWELTTNYSVMVGDAMGRQFLYEGGGFTKDTLIPTGSTSKWPSAMMFAGLVKDGLVDSLDDPVFKYFSWWTRDQADLRSTVTLRMLLSFTSGFGDGHPGQESNNRVARTWRASSGRPRLLNLHDSLVNDGYKAVAVKCDTATGDITECARSIYDSVKLIGTPGQVRQYR